MASLIPEYQYDIFISYRQKDNKADKWVTHFVEALKDEIEATFKIITDLDQVGLIQTLNWHLYMAIPVMRNW